MGFFELGTYGICLLAYFGLTFSQVYALIMFSELEQETTGPIEVCESLNVFILPEFIIHTAAATLLLLRLQVLPFAANSLLIGYHYWLWKGQKHLYDATQIFQDAKQRSIESLVKVSVYLLFFFYSLYRLILAWID